MHQHEGEGASDNDRTEYLAWMACRFRKRSHRYHMPSGEIHPGIETDYDYVFLLRFIAGIGFHMPLVELMNFFWGVGPLKGEAWRRFDGLRFKILDDESHIGLLFGVCCEAAMMTAG